VARPRVHPRIRASKSEFGVRMAVGASPADVLSLVLRESLVITTVGLTIGLGLAVLLGRGLRVAIHQISPLDPVALGAATGILVIASLAASIVPARRAANVPPMAALRNGEPQSSGRAHVHRLFTPSTASSTVKQEQRIRFDDLRRVTLP